ncbi:MAG: TolB family protein, partial [Sphingomicrobium sp.]
MTSRFVLASVLLASSAIVSAQEQAPPPQPEPSPSEAASRHELPKGAAATPTAAATEKAPKWDVEHPRGLTTHKVPLDTTEGTWMNVDVSPDGTRVAFDMLGDIYVMPISGGTPTRIAEGLSYEQQPRWSPDG